MLRSFHRFFITPIEEAHPELAGLAGWDILFSAVLEIIGEKEGAGLLRVVLETSTTEDRAMAQSLDSFLQSVGRRGFLPRRLFFAAKRYRRWERLNPDATQSARAHTLQEIFMTYGLGALSSDYPESRARFYRETVFRERVRGPLRRARRLDRPPSQRRTGSRRAQRRGRRPPRPSLARGGRGLFPREALLPIPQTRRRDRLCRRPPRAARNRARWSSPTRTPRASPSRSGMRSAPRKSGVSTACSSMPSSRSSSGRSTVSWSPSTSAAVSSEVSSTRSSRRNTPRTWTRSLSHESFSARGVARALIEELCNRLRTAGYTTLTTGFFRPQFFYRMGFTIERRYAGLVRSLVDEKGDA